MDFALPERAVALSLLSGRAHYERVVEAVMSAERSVWIATANLKELLVEDLRLRPGMRRPAIGARTRNFRSVIEIFDEHAARGVEMRVLHAAFPSRPFRAEFDRHKRLREGGIELRVCPRVHMKAVIVDAKQLYLGSANWTGAGLGAKGEHRRNFELGILTEDGAMIDSVQEVFDTIWRGAECARCRLRPQCEAPLDLEARPLEPGADRRVMPLSKVRLSSGRRIEKVAPKRLVKTPPR